MRYLQYILFPGEHILYNGRLHPVLYLRGLALLALAVATAKYLPDALASFPLPSRYAAQACAYLPPACHAPQLLCALLFLAGIFYLVKTFIFIGATELLITDRRVIVKYGVFTTITMEMDRSKIAGITVRQTMNGKLWGYGDVTLRGFAGQTARLPAVSRPYELQRFINAG